MTWKITRHMVIPEVVLSLKRTVRGNMRRHVLQDVNGPLQFRNFGVTVLVRPTDVQTAKERLDDLLDMNGYYAYYCDIIHAGDGTDHTADVRDVVVRVNQVPNQEPGLQFYVVDVELVDASLR